MKIVEKIEFKKVVSITAPKFLYKGQLERACTEMFRWGWTLIGPPHGLSGLATLVDFHDNGGFETEYTFNSLSAT